MGTRVIYAASWLVAVVLATTVGVVAVNLVAQAVRGSGPIGDKFARQNAGGGWDPEVRADPAVNLVRRKITRRFGTFVVGCQGVVAQGERAVPDEAAGWHLVRFEPGPDDDVDAVFASTEHVVEVEVFCNSGRPEIAELETSRVGDDD